jgi:hypothetical protein
MHKHFLLVSVLLVGVAAAQTVPITQNSVTNRDIVTLAKAGFNEDFILDFIQASRTRFDVTVNGLAELAKDGLSERLIRGMFAANAAAQTAPQPLVAAPSTACPQAAPMQPAAQTVPMQSLGVQPAAAMMPVGDMDTPVRSRKMSETAVAMSTGTPYYNSTTFLWGLMHKQVKIYGGQQSQPFSQLGAAYGQVHLVAPMTVGTRYVVIP